MCNILSKQNHESKRWFIIIQGLNVQSKVTLICSLDAIRPIKGDCCMWPFNSVPYLPANTPLNDVYA